MLAVGNPLIVGVYQEVSLQLRNYGSPEDGFVWSVGRWCEAAFDLDLGWQAPAAVGFTLDLDVFKVPPALPGQNVLATLNGLWVGSAFVDGRTALVFRARPADLRSAGNVLALDLPDAGRPLEFSLDDGRMLGVQVFSLVIEMVD